MNKIAIILWVPALALAMCLAAPPAAEDLLTDEKGTIQKVRDDWYAIVPDSDPGTRYAPTNLEDQFKKDGLRVTFSGKIGEIEANIRMYGTPLELTAIEILKEDP